MTHIPPTDAVSQPALSCDSSRADLILTLGDLSKLSQRSWDEVRHIHIFPGIPLDAPRIVVPHEWTPSGETERESYRTIDLQAFGSQFTDRPEYFEQWDESLRRTLLVTWLPRMTERGIRSPKPVTWLNRTKIILRAAILIGEYCPGGACIWSHLKEADFHYISRGISKNLAIQQVFLYIVRSLSDSGRRGLLADYPRPTDIVEVEATLDLPDLEQGYRGVRPQEEEARGKERRFQPFPDEFVTEWIRSAVWMQRNLGRSLIDCWLATRAVTIRCMDEFGWKHNDERVIDARQSVVINFPWTDADGNRLDCLPLRQTSSAGGPTRIAAAWPPRDLRSLKLLMGVVQVFDFTVPGFCTGARSSEIADATAESLSRAGADRFHARTFKLGENTPGDLRDWPLHPLAANALELQAYLAEAFRPEGTNHLWCHIGRDGSKMVDLSSSFSRAVESLGMSDMTGNDPAHMHRWRVTVATLVGLSVVEAPQVLLVLFGHRDLEMTLRYMLAHPDMARDAKRVAEEAAYALSLQAIDEVLHGKAGGPCAPVLREGLDERRVKRGEEFYGADSLRSLAEILTLNGRHWELVRPGVICTKLPGQFGPCTQGRGIPDPGSCRTNCDYRLELERAKKQCEEATLALLTERAAAVANDAEMLVASLDGQILANLMRWPDVRDRLLASSESAHRLWEEYDATSPKFTEDHVVEGNC